MLWWIRSFAFLISPLVLISGLSAQQAAVCSQSPITPLVRAEGLTERMGDILLNCSGGIPNGQVLGNLSIFLTVDITNRLAANNVTDVQLFIDNGSGPVLSPVQGILLGPAFLSFSGVSFQYSATGTVSLRIANLRGAASDFSQANRPFQAALSFTGSGVPLMGNSPLPVGVPQRSLLGAFSGSLVCTQRGSPLPGTATFSTLVAAGTSFTSTRLTEGFPDAFAPRGDPSNFNADSGVRILIRYSGFPADAKLFVPDAVAGSDAAVPTAGGDLGLQASGGKYVVASGTLLLVRVQGADANGAGGLPAVTLPTSGTVSFDSVSPVSLSGGAGYAVYEVVDANPAALETAQFPTFLGLPPSGGRQQTDTTEQVSLAPVSTVDTASASDPVPRYISTAPPLDCSALSDCTAPYFPILQLEQTSLAYSVAANSGFRQQDFLVQNLGQGLLRWAATVNYANGSGWLQVIPASGVNTRRVFVNATPGNLSPGTYRSTITFNGGPVAGSQTVQVTMQVTAAIPPPPQITGIVNSASLAPGPVVAGSLATIQGARLAGKAVTVTFDGVQAGVAAGDDSQIIVVVPQALDGKSSAQVIVEVDGVSSAPETATLAAIAPAIFPGGVLNQDSTPNSAANPAKVGSIVQVYATGLPASGTIFGQIANTPFETPNYAGPVEGIPGMQQVNLVVPDLPAMQTWVFVCAGDPAKPVCNAPFAIYVSR